MIFITSWFGPSWPLYGIIMYSGKHTSVWLESSGIFILHCSPGAVEIGTPFAQNIFAEGKLAFFAGCLPVAVVLISMWISSSYQLLIVNTVPHSSASGTRGLTQDMLDRHHVSSVPTTLDALQGSHCLLSAETVRHFDLESLNFPSSLGYSTILLKVSK